MFINRFLTLTICILLLCNTQTLAMLTTAARTKIASQTRLLAPQNLLKNRLPNSRSFSQQSSGDGGFLLWAVGMIGGTMVFLDQQNKTKFPRIDRDEIANKLYLKEEAKRQEIETAINTARAQALAEGRLDPYPEGPRQGRGVRF